MTSPAAPTRRQAYAAASPVTEAMIQTLVHAFYEKVRRDPMLGPIFNRAIMENAWPAHLAKLCDFWSSVTLMTGRFKGTPMQAHLRVGGIGPAHFARWLELFQKTAEETCPPEATAIFVEKSQMIGRSLQMGLQLPEGGFQAAIASPP
ncbi:group III truncated hemoglobin [Phenylobacterium immobile]|uniref:group III truncated hemoglobin n=1 Tax=Phenylobacterium immobile TaxID=21 RepID=UPI000A4500CB|nr:group III truncated hemoglobin [Phenylobacterium immobile]